MVIVFIGAWTRSAGQSFIQIVETKGRDISYVMEGFTACHKMYSLIATVMVVAIIAYLVLVIVKATQT